MLIIMPVCSSLLKILCRFSSLSILDLFWFIPSSLCQRYELFVHNCLCSWLTASIRCAISFTQRTEQLVLGLLATFSCKFKSNFSRVTNLPLNNIISHRIAFFFFLIIVYFYFIYLKRWALAAWTFHYLKREVETIFVHKFSKGTMPLFNLWKNSFYYCKKIHICTYILNAYYWWHTHTYKRSQCSADQSSIKRAHALTHTCTYAHMYTEQAHHIETILMIANCVCVCFFTDD